MRLISSLSRPHRLLEPKQGEQMPDALYKIMTWASAYYLLVLDNGVLKMVRRRARNRYPVGPVISGSQRESGHGYRRD
jgi:hypothetical protein